jgi:hypothetical protein
MNEFQGWLGRPKAGSYECWRTLKDFHSDAGHHVPISAAHTAGYLVFHDRDEPSALSLCWTRDGFLVRLLDFDWTEARVYT